MDDLVEKLRSAVNERIKGRTADAINILELLAANTESEQSAEVWGNLIGAYLETGMFKQAEDAALERLRVVQHASTEGVMVRFQLASARQRQGQFQAAVKEYAEILKWESYLIECDDSGFLHAVTLQLAVCLAHLGNNPAALALLEKVDIQALDPEQRAEAAYYIGQCYYEMQNYEAAADAYRQAMEGPVPAFQIRGRYSVGLALWQLPPGFGRFGSTTASSQSATVRCASRIFIFRAF